jgi:hypothetical protein
MWQEVLPHHNRLAVIAEDEVWVEDLHFRQKSLRGERDPSISLKADEMARQVSEQMDGLRAQEVQAVIGKQ